MCNDNSANMVFRGLAEVGFHLRLAKALHYQTLGPDYLGGDDLERCLSTALKLLNQLSEDFMASLPDVGPRHDYVRRMAKSQQQFMLAAATT